MESARGRCLCGKIEFELVGPTSYACLCHCESCRRATGGAYVPWVTVAQHDFSILNGVVARYHSSPGVTRGFCGDCGTSLTYENERRSGEVDVTVASLDDPSRFPPRSHIWVEDKLPWIVIGDDLPQFAKTAS